MSNVEKVPFHCPKHSIQLTTAQKSLLCKKGCKFPIVSNIPRFVPSNNYSEAFGEQWKHYKKTQLDSYSKSPISETRLRRCLGEDLWNNLKDKQVLEAGCGAGRFTEILLKKNANVTSIDLSEAVVANQDNFPQDANHRIAQSDILRLPFTEKKFDVVICLGVIQHTPNTEEAISSLYNQVKEGGWLIIDHYTYTLGYFTRTAPIFRFFMKRLPRGKSIEFTENLVDFFLPLHKRFRNFRIGQTLLSRFSPLVCYYHSFPEFSDEMQREWALLDTHDSLTDHYKRFRTKGQIKKKLQKLGLTEIWCEYGGNGVEARGRRPQRNNEKQ